MVTPVTEVLGVKIPAVAPLPRTETLVPRAQLAGDAA
jgi:hypothetical protein